VIAIARQLTRRDGGAYPQVKPQLAAFCTRPFHMAVPYGDDPPGVARIGFRDGVTGSFLKHVEAAVVRAHDPIIRRCGYGSSCQCQRSVLGLPLPTTLRK
jgi:hypothetical protein